MPCGLRNCEGIKFDRGKPEVLDLRTSVSCKQVEEVENLNRLSRTLFSVSQRYDNFHCSFKTPSRISCLALGSSARLSQPAGAGINTMWQTSLWDGPL